MADLFVRQKSSADVLTFQANQNRFIDCDHRSSALSIVVFGASGDLAKKKTFPALYDLFMHDYVPTHAIIAGYARTTYTHEEFRQKLSSSSIPEEPKLQSADMGKGEENLEYFGPKKAKDSFLEQCYYFHGDYDSKEAMSEMNAKLTELEMKSMEEIATKTGECPCPEARNRLFYFAVPPSVFVTIGGTLKSTLMSTSGWNRLILEKPFGTDLESFEALSKDVSAWFSEDQIYRIDHYLGKEMVLNLLALRFSNAVFEPLWNREHVTSVTITLKEDFGTQGRGGYFDQVGIIRDVIQNHLLQVLSLVAMEPPAKPGAEFVRDAKVEVLKAARPINIDQVVLGQYVQDDSGKNEGYLDDPGVPKDSITPTFATLIMYINNDRWRGVPFIVRAGKALNERKSEIRLQFKAPDVAKKIYKDTIPSNELIMRLQPNETVYMKMNVKTPGLDNDSTTISELNLDYIGRLVRSGAHIPEAYTRLILEVLRGKQATFVRDDELREAWKIFDPLIKELDEKKIKPETYKFGTRGPKASDDLATKVGYVYFGDEYVYNKTLSHL